MSIFGQNPADITGALFKAKNFSDVPDKAAARNNLDVPSKSEVQYNSVPIGMIMPYWGSVAPAGYLPCSGQTINSGSFPELVTFLGGTTTATVPDLRGEFLRGWDNGRGADTGRANGSSQLASGHYNVAGNLTTSGGLAGVWRNSEFDSLNTASVYASFAGSSLTTVTYGGSRPRNVAVLYCIKAYSSVSNYTSSVNIAGLVSDYSTLNSAAVKYADFIGTNQSTSSNGWQKLPGGLILQWGVITAVPAGTVGSFPLVFPNACIKFIVGNNNGSTASLTVSGGGTQTTSNFTVWASSGSVSGAWLAIGY